MVINGSGKTMLMRAVSGLMYPTSGTIKIDGKVLGKGYGISTEDRTSYRKYI